MVASPWQPTHTLEARRYASRPSPLLEIAISLMPSFDLPPCHEKAGGGGEGLSDDGEGSPHIRGDGGVGGASSRDSRSGAKGIPKGLARPRSAAGPGGARGRLQRRNLRVRGLM